ncbi:hypothetical protein PTKIN_Ptkin08bG0083000 [Pterospermum kingtungense]
MISLSVVYNRSCDLLVRGLQKHSIPFLPFLLFVFPFPFSFLLSHQPRTLSQSTYFSKPSPSDVGTDYYHSPSDTCHFVSSESYRLFEKRSRNTRGRVTRDISQGTDKHDTYHTSSQHHTTASA